MGTSRRVGEFTKAGDADRGRRRRALLGAGALAVVVPLCLLADTSREPSTVQAPERILVYRVYEDSDDLENRRVVFTASLALARVESIGNMVGWEVRRVHLRQLHGDGAASVWVDSLPVVESHDGLWWTAHRNPHTLALTDFSTLPRLAGTARPQVPQEPDLVYTLESAAYPRTPGQVPTELTAVLNYAFSKIYLSEPEPEEEDEPVGVEPGNSDPPVGGPEDIPESVR